MVKNWRNRSLYQFDFHKPDSNNPAHLWVMRQRYAWEFLRRNAEYQVAYEDYYTKHYEPIFVKCIYHGGDESECAQAIEAEGEKSRAILDKWDIIPLDYRDDNPGIPVYGDIKQIFTPFLGRSVGGCRCSTLEKLDMSKNIEPPEETVRVYPGECVFAMDVRFSEEMQIQNIIVRFRAAKEREERRQRIRERAVEALKSGVGGNMGALEPVEWLELERTAKEWGPEYIDNLINANAPKLNQRRILRPHYNKFPLYLQVFDGVADGATYEEIALYTPLEYEYRKQPKRVIGKIKRAHAAAIELVEGGYKALIL